MKTKEEIDGKTRNRGEDKKAQRKRKYYAERACKPRGRFAYLYLSVGTRAEKSHGGIPRLYLRGAEYLACRVFCRRTTGEKRCRTNNRCFERKAKKTARRIFEQPLKKRKFCLNSNGRAANNSGGRVRRFSLRTPRIRDRHSPGSSTILKFAFFRCRRGKAKPRRVDTSYKNYAR